jgi:hypothetical protein
MFGISSMQGSVYSKSQLGNQNLKFIKDTVETLEIHMDPPIQYECALHRVMFQFLYTREFQNVMYMGVLVEMG